MERRVICAAIRKDGSVIASPRHFDAFAHKAINEHAVTVCFGHSWWKDAEQGFICQHGQFMSREEALEVARAAGQILYRCGGDERELFSENLY